MKQLTRREFLRLLAAGSGAITLNHILAACGMGHLITETPGQPEVSPTGSHSPTAVQPSPSATTTPTRHTEPTPTATQPPPTATSTPIGMPDLVVARNGDPQALVRRAIDALGGLNQFIPRGAEVIIKPNICVEYRTYKYAAATNPWVVGALVMLCQEAGAGSVRVMDHTYQSKMRAAYRKSGIQEQVEAAGGEMVVMDGYKFIPTELPLGRDIDTLWLYEGVLNADVLINVPIAKHHFIAGLTLGMKNLMGVMEHRLTLHTNMGQRIADLNSRVRPTLNVMDATRMLMSGGPTGGNLDDVRQLDTVIASADIVALDSYTAGLFGMKPLDLEYLRAARSMGLGESDLKKLRIEEIHIS
jgi:uncharacterized protein (DUF362 family)